MIEIPDEPDWAVKIPLPTETDGPQEPVDEAELEEATHPVEDQQ